MPQRVEIPTGGFRANRLHFLGNVAGWGFPYSRDTDVVLKATVQFTDGTAEVLEFRNGVDIADYISRNDVTGSKFAEGITKNAQVRWNSRTLEATRPIEKIVLESTGGLVAPTTFAITAELSVDNPPTAITSSAIPNPIFSTRPAPPTDEAAAREALNAPVPEPPATRPEAGPRVLLVGGGSSHDFAKFFGASDKTTLTPAVGWVDFTQNLNGIGPVLKNVDVVVLSANQPISVATREALMNYANAGGGLVVLHAGGWYGWNYFPQWNREIVGGGTKSHDPLGPFTVTTTNGASPITKGVPVKFEITDELYNYVPDPEGTPIEVLAAATSPKTGKTFPQVFIVKHPRARIIGITLGHDAQAHDHPAYQSLLKNAVNWAGAK
jgi:type 1 glutamine amidotransferase